MYSYLTSAQLSDVYSDLSEGDFLWVLVATQFYGHSLKKDINGRK